MCSIYQQSSVSSTWSSTASSTTSSPPSQRLLGDRFISARCGQEAGSNFDTKAMIFQQHEGGKPLCYSFEEDRNQENNQGGANGVP